MTMETRASKTMLKLYVKRCDFKSLWLLLTLIFTYSEAMLISGASKQISFAIFFRFSESYSDLFLVMESIIKTIKVLSWVVMAHYN